MKINQNN